MIIVLTQCIVIIIHSISEKTCGKPNVAESSTIQGKSYLFGEKVTIICANGKEYTLTCQSSGKWSDITDSAC